MFVSKYALSTGIAEMQGQVSQGYFLAEGRWSSFKIGRDAHATMEEAMQAAESARRAKIASLGLRIRHGCSFHGLALNVDMDLAPFRRINPCGYAGLAMTQLSDHAAPIKFADVSARLRAQLVKHLDYAEQTTLTGGID